MKSKILLFVAVLSQLTCHQALFVAPPDSTMDCFANPEVIPASRGVSIISCLVQEGETGSPVADGTVVQFFTNLGRIPEQGRTNDGVVRVNFESTGRSGTANIQAFSGGGSSVGTSSSVTGPTSTTINVFRGVSASDNQTSAALSGVAAADSVPVLIGNVDVGEIFISAFPTRLTDARTSQITATVFDADGNPLAGVPVFFAITATSVVSTPVPTATPTATATPVPTGGVTESLDSQGQPVFTDTNGQARDTLRTRLPRDGGVRTVQVLARVPTGGRSDPVVITIN